LVGLIPFWKGELWGGPRVQEQVHASDSILVASGRFELPKILSLDMYCAFLFKRMIHVFTIKFFVWLVVE